VQLVLLEINQSISFQNNRLINSESDITSKLTFLCPATFQELLVPLTDVHLHLNRRLKPLLHPITAPAENLPHFILPLILMLSQVFPQRCRIKCKNLPTLSAIFPTADRSVEGLRVDHVLVISLNILVFEDHMPSHLLDSLCIGEAGWVRSKAELALESLSGMLLLDMPHSLSLYHLIPTEVASLSWPRSVCSTILPVQPRVVSAQVVRPLHLVCAGVGEDEVATPTGQLKLSHDVRLFRHQVHLLKMFLNGDHVLCNVACQPEALAAQNMWRGAQLAGHFVQRLWDCQEARDCIRNGDIELVG